MTEKLKVSIDHNGCISCGTCWNDCPEFFEQNPKDACSQVIDEYRVARNPGEGEAPVEFEKTVRRAANLCQVQIIRI
jgi:ferredoxin